MWKEPSHTNDINVGQKYENDVVVGSWIKDLVYTIRESRLRHRSNFRTFK